MRDGPWDVRGMYMVYAGWSMGRTRFNFHPANIRAYTTYSPRDLCFLPMLLQITVKLLKFRIIFLFFK